jgi:hypothetical protein
MKTKEECQKLYLDWLNNFLSDTKFREYYNLGIDEMENILDVGRQYNKEVGEKIYQQTGRIKQNNN